MPRPQRATASSPADLRRLQGRLPDLPVSVLLRLREATASALERERLDSADIATVLEAAEPAR